MRYLKGLILFSLVVVLGAFNGKAQELDPQYNPNSMDPIPKYEQLFKKRCWLRIDMKEKQNKGFFASNSEVSKLLIDAVKSGELADAIYVNDSLKTKMTKEEFLENMVAAEAPDIDPFDPDIEYYEGDQVLFNGKLYICRTDETLGIYPDTSEDDWELDAAGGEAELFFPKQVSIVRLMEDRIFDKRRSRLYYDVQSLELIIPGDQRLDGLDKTVGVFSYKDVEKVFRNHPDEAVWFNVQNSAENKNFADAVLLRLFHGVLVKIENPDDVFIADIYNKSRKEGVMASQWLEQQLMEKEHNLWEF